MPITVQHTPSAAGVGSAAFAIGAGMRRQEIEDQLRRQAFTLQQQQYSGQLQESRDFRLDELTRGRDQLLHGQGMEAARYNAVLQADRDLRQAGIRDESDILNQGLREQQTLLQYGLSEQAATTAAARQAAQRKFEFDLLKGFEGFKFGLGEQGKLSSFDLQQAAADQQLFRQAELNAQQASFDLGRIGYSAQQQYRLAQLQNEHDEIMNNPRLRNDERKAAIAYTNAQIQAIRDRPWRNESGGIMTLEERKNTGLLEERTDGSIVTVDSEGNTRVFRTDGGQLREQLSASKLRIQQLQEEQRRQAEQARQAQPLSPSDLARLYQVGLATLNSQLGRVPTEVELNEFVRRSMQMQQEFGGHARQGGGFDMMGAIGGAIGGFARGGLPGALLGGFSGAAQNSAPSGPSYVSPQGKSYSAADVQTTAERYGVSTDEVIRRAGLSPTGTSAPAPPPSDAALADKVAWLQAQGVER